MLDETFDLLMQKYGKKWCLRTFGMGKNDSLPRRETRVLVNTSILDYIKTLGIEEEDNEIITKDQPPPLDRPVKKER